MRFSRAAAADAADVIVYTIGLGDGVLDCVIEELLAAARRRRVLQGANDSTLDEAFEAIAKKTTFV